MGRLRRGYAALDVEVLVDLRDAIAADLTEQGKWEWAAQEFDSLLGFTGPAPRVDPWRRTSGMHKIRRRRGVAVVRELWYVRDRIAQRRDVSPGRVLSDAALVALAVEPPKDAGAFAARRELRGVARSPKVWLDAIDKALALSEDALPPLTPVSYTHLDVYKRQALMSQTQNISQIVELESQLAQREADLESLQAQLASMTKRIAMATVTVTVSSNPDVIPPVEQDGFLTGLRSGWNAFLASLTVGLTVLGALLPWLVVLALIACLLYTSRCV